MSDKEKSSSEDENDFETLLQRNKQERMAFLASCKTKATLTEALEALKVLQPDKPKRIKSNASRTKTRDSAFKFRGAIPAQRRWSIRLNHKKPDYADDDKVSPNENGYASSDSFDDLEDVVFLVKKRRKSNRALPPREIIPVEEVTQKMLSDICTRGRKQYSDSGTSCHQCRQKTIDTKTICRSGFCVGVRGQFCGICVINRYGEDPHVALKDPSWICYVCRGVCNCSFCRSRVGKKPTGILTPTAFKYGFKSVKHYLDNLKGYGDYSRPENDPNNLLGFRDSCTAVMGGNNEVVFNCIVCGLKRENNPQYMLGFEKNCAVMGNQSKLSLDCEVCKFKQ